MMIRQIICFICMLQIFLVQVNALLPPEVSSRSAEINLKSSRIYLSSTDEIKNNEIVSSMPPPLPSSLRNTFYLLRHGQSTANVAGIISSARSLMYSDKHGLTPEGEKQGKASALQLKELVTANINQNMGNKIVFYSSPFARARQTAQVCLDTLLQDHMDGMTDWDVKSEVILEDGLIERYFGRLDDTKIHTYGYVWPVDMFDVTNTGFDVESVAAVATRIRETILRIDAQHDQEHIVLTSHADVLQITQLYAAGAENVGMFSQYRFGNGEVRRMDRDITSLPVPVPLEPPKPTNN